jgi:plastocyanin
MFRRTRLVELGVVMALAIAVAALVLAIRGGGGEPVAVAREPESGPGKSVAIDFVPKGAVAVDIVDFAYNPDPVRVKAGTPIAWTNFDEAAHTVTAEDGSWGSEVMSKGDTFVITFDEPGTYVYICELHPPHRAGILGAPAGVELVLGGGPGMQATIIVE